MIAVADIGGIFACEPIRDSIMSRNRLIIIDSLLPFENRPD